MVSVQTVYNTLKDLANKDQKGFITPAVFNNFAAPAQINIYNELFQELVKAKQIQRQNFDPGRDKSVRKQVKEDLSYFVVSDFTIDNTETSSNIFFKPGNLSKIISISYSDQDRSDIQVDEFPDNTTDATVTVKRHERRPVELVYDVEEIDRILTSNLSTPTESFPVALIAQDIEVFPTSITDIRLTYYRRPGSIDQDGEPVESSPAYNEVLIGGNNVFNPSSSLNFMLPSHYLTELVMEIAKLIGVRLRDPNIVGFAAQEEASE
tara:strand:+ start:323 stop:1117 length:795 start_codon:yes stop_codon:yes gene_type:complete